MGFWNWLFGRKKEEAKRRKKKILLGILIPIALIIIALAIFLGFHFCKKRTPSAQTLTINADVITNNPQCVVPSNNDIWYGEGNSDKISLCHNLFDLYEFSHEPGNDDITSFTIDGNIDVGFLVGFDMNCSLYGTSGSSVNLTGIGRGCAIIVGSQTKPINSTYTGNLYVDSTMTFNMTITTDRTITDVVDPGICGVLINKTEEGSKQTINGTFNIFESVAMNGFGGKNWHTYGVYFNSEVSSTIIISGVFHLQDIGDINNKNEGPPIGVYFKGIVKSASKLEISGIFWVAPPGIKDFGFGVTFNANIEVGSEQIINGIFILITDLNGSFAPTSYLSATAIYFKNDVGGDVTISGTFIIGCEGFGIDFASPSSIKGHIIINGKFVIYGGAGVAIFQTGSIKFDSTTGSSSGTIEMTSANFFGFSKDDTNIFSTSFNACTYEWNGNIVNSSSTAATSSDTSLRLQVLLSNPTAPINYVGAQISDDGKSNDSRRTFNGAYKIHLFSYINSSECPITAKSWLESIYNEIIVP